MVSVLLERLFYRGVDPLLGRLPRRIPAGGLRRPPRIVAHRGDHAGPEAPENSLAAFARSRRAGVWGVELDLRWTRDLVPVAAHDPDCRRLFGGAERIATLRFSDLRRRYPLIPSMAEVVETCRGRLHLMIEVKSEPRPDPPRQAAILETLLSSLHPGRDYHILGLTPQVFRLVPFAFPAACLAVAQTNTRAMSRWARAQGAAGVAGHYLLVTRGCLARHRACGQKVGTGFVESRGIYLREWARGVEWVFSNRAAALAAEVRGGEGRGRGQGPGDGPTAPRRPPKQRRWGQGACARRWRGRRPAA
jgi:glycerophosphoryl diester phosphodiesterase